jgi:hypothetical protein
MMQHRFIASFYVTVLFLSSFSTAIPIVRRQKRHIVVRPDGKVFSADHFHVPSIDHDGGGKEHDDDDSRRHDFAIVIILLIYSNFIISNNFFQKYLNEFGYLSTLRPTPRELKTAVESFQSMIGVPTTGNLNQETMEQMMQPRCGNNDVSRNVRDRRKRFGLFYFLTIPQYSSVYSFIPFHRSCLVYISRWENKMSENNVLRLKWYIENYTSDIPKARIK